MSRAISERRRPPEPKASNNSARSRRSTALPRPQVASSWSRMSRVIAEALLRAARPIGGANGETQRIANGRIAERPFEPAPAMQAGPEREAPPHRRRRMRADRFQATFGAQGLGDRLGHAVLGIFLALFLVPQMMGDEAQHGRFRRRPDERRIRCGARPSLEIGEIGASARSEFGPVPVLARCVSVSISAGRQRLGQTVSRRHRQKSGERVDRKIVALRTS